MGDISWFWSLVDVSALINGGGGSGGGVYVPHIDEHKVLSWTHEDNPTAPPDPVDLNPNDEWGDMGSEEIESDYVWEPMED